MDCTSFLCDPVLTSTPFVQLSNHFMWRALLQLYFRNQITPEKNLHSMMKSFSTLERLNSQWTLPPRKSKALNLYASHSLHQTQLFQPKPLTRSNLSAGEQRVLDPGVTRQSVSNSSHYHGTRRDEEVSLSTCKSVLYSSHCHWPLPIWSKRCTPPPYVWCRCARI